MNNNPWRVTEVEFMTRFNDLMDSLIKEMDKEKYIDKISKIGGKNYHLMDLKSAKKNLSIKIRTMDRLGQHDIDYELLRCKAVLVCNYIPDFKYNRAIHMPLDEVMLKIIGEEIFKRRTGTRLKMICSSFVLDRKDVTEEFVKDMVYVTSGYFDFNKWNDEEVLKICKKLNDVNIDEKSFSNDDPYDQLDWNSIAKHNYSDEFKQLFSKKLENTKTHNPYI